MPEKKNQVNIDNMFHMSQALQETYFYLKLFSIWNSNFTGSRIFLFAKSGKATHLEIASNKAISWLF